MAGPDLEPARRLAEQMLDDDVRLVRDANRVTGGELDEETGAIAADGDDSTEWTGKGLLLPGGQPHALAPGAPAPLEREADEYAALVPLSAPTARAGDVLQVLASRRDPQLAGREFIVRGPGLTGTYTVLRRLTLDPRPVA